jgi:hypothetical protein
MRQQAKAAWVQVVFVAMTMGCLSMAAAATANGPICDTAARVTGTSGGLNMSNGTCSTWNHRAMIVGSFRYQAFAGCANSCSGSACNGGAGNYHLVTGANGFDFRQLYTNNPYATVTCDRCTIGLVGASGGSGGGQVRADNRQYGTRLSGWYSGTVVGASAYCGNRVGSPTL